jgi:hypothetical protein
VYHNEDYPSHIRTMATNNKTKPRILSFGIAAVDFVAVVDHFPEPDEKIRSSSLLIGGGGNAANSACGWRTIVKLISRRHWERMPTAISL